LGLETAVLHLILYDYPIYLIGNTPPDTNNISIASQWQFVQVFFEVVQESLVLPLFFFVGTSVSQDKSIIIKKVVNSFWTVTLTLTPLLILISFFIGAFIEVINTQLEIATQTSHYLTKKIWTLLFNIVSLGLVVIIETLKKSRLLIILTLVKFFLSVSLDSIFFGGYSFSLEMGIEGLTIANLLTKMIAFFVVLFLLIRLLEIDLKTFFKLPQKSDLSVFGKVSLGISIQSLVKNIAYFFLIIRFINTLGSKEIGGYYLSMHLLLELLPCTFFSNY
jgi:hypothetical protein